MIIVSDLTIQTLAGPPLVAGLYFRLPADANLFVVGESGSGKSSFLEALAGLSPHYVSGWVARIGDESEERRVALVDRRKRASRELAGTRDRRRRRDRRGYVLEDCLLAIQDSQRAFSLYRRLGPQIEDGLDAQAMDRESIGTLFESLGLDPVRVRRAFPHFLSAGMLRRVHVASVLAALPEFALFDEPTAGVDPSRRWAVIEAIRTHARRFVIATHDVDLLSPSRGDHVLVLKDGKAVEFGPAAELLKSPADAYTASLLAAGRSK